MAERFPETKVCKCLIVLDSTIMASAGLMLLALSFTNGVEKVGSGLLTYFSGAIPRVSVLIDNSGKEVEMVDYFREPADAYEIKLDDAFAVYRNSVLPLTLAAGTLAGVVLSLRRS